MGTEEKIILENYKDDFFLRPQNSFIANSPKAEYDTPQCKNKANVYKSRGKIISIHTDDGISVKRPNAD